MKALLSPAWELSTEHAAGSHGQPVLVNRRTGDAFGPGDVVTLSPSHGDALAADGPPDREGPRPRGALRRESRVEGIRRPRVSGR